MSSKSRYQLHILSRAGLAVTKKLKKAPGNALWVFVGYCFEEPSKGAEFDIIVNAKNAQWEHDNKISLVEILDEAGNSHKKIPQGYKTICLLQCKPVIPAYIKDLPVDSTWNFKRKGVYICDHDSIDILNPLNNNNTTLAVIVSMFKKYLKLNNTDTISKKEAAELFSPSSDIVIDNLIVSGSVKEEKGKLVLAVVNAFVCIFFSSLS